jgi:hypothetical protein
MKLSAFFHSNWCERSDTTCMRYSWMTGRALLNTKMSGVWNAAPLLRGCLIFRGLANQFPAFAITVIYQYLTGYERSLWVAELHDHLCLMFYPASKTQSLIVSFKFIPARCATIVSEASHTLRATLSLGRSYWYALGSFVRAFVPPSRDTLHGNRMASRVAWEIPC